MARHLSGSWLGRLRPLFEAGGALGLTDGQLLERFATRSGTVDAERAFALLVERHGAMVLRVCRAKLGDEHDAMDAFQAAFLVLARKGGSLWVDDSIGPWLHRVALRASSRVLREKHRRRAGERAAVAQAIEIEPDHARREVVAVVQEEVDRLPERFRAAIVLCDLEGRTCEEAARHLGCPVGTIGSRLSRGRERLRRRLIRRGLAPQGVSASALWGLRSVSVALPEELAALTARAATRFSSSRAVGVGFAVSLAEEVIGSMTRSTMWKLASSVLVACAATTGFVALAGASPDDKSDATSVEVKKGEIQFVVKERGSLEATKVSDLANPTDGPITIRSILPEGTRVKKDQVVAELDSAALWDARMKQGRELAEVESMFRQARIDAEIAEIGLKEFDEGTAVAETERAGAQIKLAELDLKNATERVDRVLSALKRLNALSEDRKTAPTPADVAMQLDLGERLAEAEATVARSRLALEQATTQQRILTTFTHQRVRKQKLGEVEKASALLTARKAFLEGEQLRGKMLAEQLNRCKLVAPHDGLIVYDVDSDPKGTRIEEGAVVRGRQPILNITDLERPLVVASKIPEAIVDRLKPGQTARITVDAFSSQSWEGVVRKVAPLPDRDSYFNRGVKVYTTQVEFSKPVPEIRPGMTATVEILVQTKEGLKLPRSAVHQFDGQFEAAIQTKGGVEWRRLRLGIVKPDEVEILSGLQEGEIVVRDVKPLLRDELKRRLIQAAPPPLKKA